MLSEIDVLEYKIFHCVHRISHHIEEVIMGNLFDRTNQYVTFIVHIPDNADVFMEIF